MTTLLIVLSIIVGLVLFLVFFPSKIVLSYIDGEPSFYVKLWYIWKIRLFESKKKKTSKDKKNQESYEEKKVPVSEIVDNLGTTLKVYLAALKTVCKLLTMYRCKVRILVAGEDPADVAIDFGTVNAAVYGIISVIDENIKITHKNIFIGYDYEKEESDVEIDFRFRFNLIKFLFRLLYTNLDDIIKMNQNKLDRR